MTHSTNLRMEDFQEIFDINAPTPKNIEGRLRPKLADSCTSSKCRPVGMIQNVLKELGSLEDLKTNHEK